MESSVDWDKVDWTLPDAELARHIKVSREWIRQMRRRLKIPDSPFKNSPFPYFWKEVQRNPPTKRSQLVKLCKKHGIKHIAQKILDVGLEKERKDCPECWNYDLPNKVLSQIWKVEETRVGGYRSRFVSRPSKWTLKECDCPECLAEMKQEKAKAEAWFIKRKAWGK